jgi:hypothetical protein
VELCVTIPDANTKADTIADTNPDTIADTNPDTNPDTIADTNPDTIPIITVEECLETRLCSERSKSRLVESKFKASFYQF